MMSSASPVSTEPGSPSQHQIEHGPARILVVDDEDAIRISLGELLRRHKYTVEVAANGEEALACIRDRPFDLVLLDVVLPGLSGIEIAQRTRQIQPETKIILLTGHGTLESALEGMHLGVFDYLLKTDPTPHILARVAEAVMVRREERHKHQLLDEIQTVIHELSVDREPLQQPQVAPQTIDVGPLHISPWQQSVRIGERVARLTATELHVLACLAQHAGQVLTYHEIAREGLGNDIHGTQAAELIKPHIYHLRHKLEPDPANPRYILTVRSVGYLLAVEAGEQGG